jgi:hypothetical protein
LPRPSRTEAENTVARLVRVEIKLDLADPLEELLEHPPFAGICRNKIVNEAVLLLTVAVDTAHPLFKADRVPGDIVVDHQPAELKIDAFARRFGCHEDLVGFPELAFGANAGTRRIAIADLHPAVNLSHGEVPLT